MCIILQPLHERSRWSLIRHRKKLLHRISYLFDISAMKQFLLESKSECEWEKSLLVTIQDSSVGHHFMLFGTSGIKYYQVKCAVFLVYRKIYFTKELSTWNMLHQNPFLFLTIAWQCCSVLIPVLFRFIFLFPSATEQW